jgi:hypothetical protein
MSKLRTLTYGTSTNARAGEPPSVLLEWTDDDRVILHTGPRVGPSSWDVPVGEIARVGGLVSWLTLVPKDGDRVRVWFGNPGTSPTQVDTLAYDDAVARSGILEWAEAFREAGVRTRYLSTKATYWIAFAIVPAIVVVAAIIITTAQRIAAGG